MARGSYTVSVTEKHCSKCQRLLPAAMFNKANWLATGLRSDCKDCYKAFKAEWWAAQPKSSDAVRWRELKQLAKSGARRCRTCEEIKPLDKDNFSLVRGFWNSSCCECVRKRTKDWVANNREYAAPRAAARCAERYASKRHRTPRWQTKEDREQIQQIYIDCRRITKETGIIHHVDHIVPLVGKYISGLHVPGNLRIIPGSENCRKSNKWSS
jgi:hypothetical protein